MGVYSGIEMAQKYNCINIRKKQDPACGTFGFMIAAFQYVYNTTDGFMTDDGDMADFEYNEAFTGCELVFMILTV